MKTFVVETYMPASEAEFQASRARLAGSARSGVRYLRSTFVPADELCFHVFMADSVEAVREVTDLASIPIDRIVEAVEGS